MNQFHKQCPTKLNVWIEFPGISCDRRVLKGASKLNVLLLLFISGKGAGKSLSRAFPPSWENLEAVSPGHSLPLGKPLELSVQEVPFLLGIPWSCLSRRFPPSWENLGAVSQGGSLPLGKTLQLSLKEVPSLLGKPWSCLSRKFSPSWSRGSAG